MRTTYRVATAAREIDPGSYEAQAVDVILAHLTRLGWNWTTDSEVVNDPAGQPHYIPAEAGFAEQLANVYELHKDLIRLGMLSQEPAR